MFNANFICDPFLIFTMDWRKFEKRFSVLSELIQCVGHNLPYDDYNIISFHFKNSNFISDIAILHLNLSWE